jgi:hypothetical protein
MDFFVTGIIYNMYKITSYTYKQAKQIGVTVKPSTNKTKKIDVYKKGHKIASVGASGMNDYPTYMLLERQGKVPKGYADERRRLYRIRHKNDRTSGAGKWADVLLW